MKPRELIVLLVLTQGLAACDSASSSTPTAPSTLAQPTAPSAPPNAGALVVFREPSGFSTTEVRDDQDHIVQFTNGGDLIWGADGTHFPGYEVAPDSAYWGPPTYFISGKICVDFCVFSVRFGTRDGQRRAYLTLDYGHYNPGTLAHVEVEGNELVVTQTPMFPPGTPTLSGLVTEATPTGPVAVAGAVVSRSVPAGWQQGTTGQDGLYTISGLIDGTAEVVVGKEGYQKESRQVALNGDTRFDVELVRR